MSRSEASSPATQATRRRGLTPSAFLAGLRCPRNLYFQTLNLGLASPADPFMADLGGDRILACRAASGRFPEGRWASPPGAASVGNSSRTADLLADPSVPAIFGAVLNAEGLTARPDILWRNRDGSWDLILVLPTRWVSHQSVWELAFNQYVLARAGLEVRHAEVMYINGDYVRPLGDHCLDRLFVQEDCRDRTVDLMDRVPVLADRFLRALSGSRPPAVSTGAQCRTPGPCPFQDRCLPPRPEHWVGDFYRMTAARKSALLQRGIKDIRDIPDDEPLTPMQRRIRDVLRTGTPYVSPQIVSRLRTLRRPLHYLDFETFCPAVPPYPGTSPYDLIPFQWSLHTEDDTGGLRHEAFLADGFGDPRPEFVERLVSSVGPQGEILTYTHYERQVLRALKDSLPRLADQLDDLAGRCVDLCAMLRKHVYHPGFGQSFSLKTVLPALAPHLTYQSLDVREGLAASQTFLAITGELDEARRGRLRRALLDYCHRDTLAMVVIKRYILNESEPSHP